MSPGCPARVQLSGRYDASRFEMQADSQGTLVVQENQALPFRMMSRSRAQRLRDCSAQEAASSRAQVAQGTP